MDAEEALHTAARRYCEDRWSVWYRQYSDMRRDRGDSRLAFMYRLEDYSVVPRYRLLEAILVEIESVLPTDFDTVESLRDYLVVVGEAAESDATTNLGNSEIAVHTMDLARHEYCEYIRHLTLADLRDIAPLPFVYRLTR